MRENLRYYCRLKQGEVNKEKPGDNERGAMHEE